MPTHDGNHSLETTPPAARRASHRPATRRERRIAARRAQILDAADRVFADKGYRGATTREIAEAADVSEGTLYNYFSSKRELFVGLMKARTDSLVQAIAAIEAADTETLVHLLAGQFLQLRQRRHFRLFLHEAGLDPQLNRYLREQVLARISQQARQRMQALIDQGVMRPVDPAIASWTMIASIVGLAIFADLGTDSVLEAVDPEVLGARVGDIFLNGLVAPDPQANGA